MRQWRESNLERPSCHSFSVTRNLTQPCMTGFYTIEYDQDGSILVCARPMHSVSGVALHMHRPRAVEGSDLDSRRISLTSSADSSASGTSRSSKRPAPFMRTTPRTCPQKNARF